MPQDDVATAAHEAAETTISLLMETASVGIRQTETVGARVRVTVSDHEETVTRLLAQQNATIERVAIGRVVSETPAVRHEGDVTIVPVMEEVLVVETRLVLREELHIRISETRQPATQTVRLRREHAEIDHGDLPRSASIGDDP